MSYPTDADLQEALVACTKYFTGQETFDYAMTALRKLASGPASFDDIIHQDEDGLFKTIDYCLMRLREKYDAAKHKETP